MTRRRFLVAFTVVAFVLAGLVSTFASSSPDGLERVAADQGMSATEREHPLADWPLADYAVAALDHPIVSGGLAGFVGVVAVLLLTTGLVFLVRRRSADSDGC